jgi:hypothetical protein
MSDLPTQESGTRRPPASPAPDENAHDCIARLVKDGEITPSLASNAEALYRAVLADTLTAGMDEAEAETYARLKTAQIIAPDAAARRRELATWVNALIELAELKSQGRGTH